MRAARESGEGEAPAEGRLLASRAAVQAAGGVESVDSHRGDPASCPQPPVPSLHWSCCPLQAFMHLSAGPRPPSGGHSVKWPATALLDKPPDRQLSRLDSVLKYFEGDFLN